MNKPICSLLLAWCGDCINSCVTEKTDNRLVSCQDRKEWCSGTSQHTGGKWLMAQVGICLRKYWKTFNFRLVCIKRTWIIFFVFLSHYFNLQLRITSFFCTTMQINIIFLIQEILEFFFSVFLIFPSGILFLLSFPLLNCAKISLCLKFI